ncbi:hypothetical protein CDCA_CDCA11G3211 [Cyanidium caldarium]|uniref:Cation efflux protein cytoplasmic domain-containing protein n=1 Tax=Cyanidium caldarium TaxID=2771 RepID=A0AAV9IYF9_CYACA|nr:hypothetical protein CDCA_CDCA11G3211 [Cyanidium caldarium]
MTRAPLPGGSHRPSRDGDRAHPSRRARSEAQASAMTDSATEAARRLHQRCYRGDLSAVSSAPLRAFYERQNALLEAFAAVPPADLYWTATPGKRSSETANDITEGHNATCHVDEESPLLRQEPETSSDNSLWSDLLPSTRLDDEERRARRAIILSNAVNVLLLLAQVYVYYRTGSLALLANTVDAALDFLSGLIVAGTWYLRRHADGLHTRYAYPVGRARLESVGVLVMAVLMTALTLNVLLESSTALMAYARRAAPDAARGIVLTPIVLALIAIALSSKLLLYRLCRTSRHDGVAALATDHLNDCISNVGALSAAATSRWWPPLDPLGGIAFSVFILRNWWNTTSTHLDHLISRSASCELYSVVTFAALWHDERIRAIDRVCLYHVGPACFAEVDLLLDRNMPLADSHDVGESLQVRIERIPGIERCFVHLDYETQHGGDLEHKRPV